MTKEEIEKRIDELRDKTNELFNESCDMPNGWEWYKNRPEHKELADLVREYTIMLDDSDIKYSPIDKNGDKMTLKHFVECCKCGGFIDYDGFGNYATEDKQTDIEIYPSDVMSGKYRKDFTHVVWYNR